VVTGGGGDGACGGVTSKERRDRLELRSQLPVLLLTEHWLEFRVSDPVSMSESGERSSIVMRFCSFGLRGGRVVRVREVLFSAEE
jgi:hypothetical protein